jgi:hypothetical protein
MTMNTRLTVVMDTEILKRSNAVLSFAELVAALWCEGLVRISTPIVFRSYLCIYTCKLLFVSHLLIYINVFL